MRGTGSSSGACSSCLKPARRRTDRRARKAVSGIPHTRPRTNDPPFPLANYTTLDRDFHGFFKFLFFFSPRKAVVTRARRAPAADHTTHFWPRGKGRFSEKSLTGGQTTAILRSSLLRCLESLPLCVVSLFPTPTWDLQGNGEATKPSGLFCHQTPTCSIFLLSLYCFRGVI